MLSDAIGFCWLVIQVWFLNDGEWLKKNPFRHHERPDACRRAWRRNIGTVLACFGANFHFLEILLKFFAICL